LRVLHLLAASVAVLLVTTTSPTRADFESSKAWFLSLDSEVPLNIQSELVLVGDYDALLDGSFGSSTYTGLTRYQAKHFQVADGVLSPEELNGLLGDARAVYGQLGIIQTDDTVAGVSIYLPISLLTDKKAIPNGNAYSSDDGQIELDTYGQPHASASFTTIFAGLNSTTADRSVTYSTLGSDSFVVTGRDSDGFFYDR
jgi:peptidoglycan hydrolase-like protein with peptidoglycan-binding domain